MLSKEDNEALVRVGPGTPMGELMRRYWIPFLPIADLKKDGQPQRVRLLGEDLVAFRDTEGRIGLVDHACPHRGAPLIFARNEDCGLRCIYHGWKFGTDGKVQDMPAEPADSRLKDKMRIKAYMCRERNGFAWAYMGPDQEHPPELPQLEWNMVPAERVAVSIRVQECNWLQAVEGEIDSAHAAILHGRIDEQGAINDWLQKKDLRPQFECQRQDFGMSIASRRKLDDKTSYWRVNQFLLPFYTMVPPFSKFPELSGHAWVPIDDENTLCIMFSYHPSQELYPRTRALFEQGHGAVRQVLDEVQPRERLSVQLRRPDQDVVLRLARPVGSGRRLPVGCGAGVRPLEGTPGCERYRRRDDAPPPAGIRAQFARAGHRTQGRDRSRDLHGPRGVAHAAGRRAVAGSRQ